MEFLQKAMPMWLCVKMILKIGSKNFWVCL